LDLVGRMEHKIIKPEFGSSLLIDDCYNAGPESVKSAITSLENMEVKGKKILILGDMYELGSDTKFWHRQIGRFLQKMSNLDYLILVGNLVKYIKETLPISLPVDMANDWHDAVKLLKNKLKKLDVVLVKGSTHGHTSGLADFVDYMTINKVKSKTNLIDLDNKNNLIKPAVSIKESLL